MTATQIVLGVVILAVLGVVIAAMFKGMKADSVVVDEVGEEEDG